MKNDSFLTKIHGLRGFSILLVLLFHFFETVFRGGYLGVDIFFVISGYIVTKSTYKYWPNKKNDIFEFIKMFYVNRIARLLPVGLLVSTVSLLLALVFTSNVETATLVNFYKSSLLGFTNILLFINQQNYFSQSQEFNFFTQTWSLGVEEQFYVIYSLLICLVPFLSKKIVSLFVGITVVSFLANMSFLRFSSDEAHFFLLPFRLWEMSLGVFVFLEQERIKSIFQKAGKFFEIYAPLALIAAFFIKYSPNSFPFPILAILLPAVIYVIACSDIEKGSKFDQILNSKFLSFFGTISYSLYLIHWPVVVFIKYTFGKSFVPMAIGMVISILLAYIVTHNFESPLNKIIRKKRIFVLYPLSVLAILITLSHTFVNSNPLYLAGKFDVKDLHWKQEFGDCVTDTDDLEGRVRQCFTPKRDKFQNVLFAVGDSHAAQMTLMLKEFAQKNNQEVILYHSGDKPNSIHGFMRDDWKDSPRIFEELLKNGKANDTILFTFGSFHIEKASKQEILNAERVWGRYLKKLLAKDIKVVFVLDLPYFQMFPIESCIFDSKFKSSSRCEITREEYVRQRAKQKVFFEKLISRHPGIKMWDVIDEFCTDKCSAIVDGKVEYFDYNHISKERALQLEPGFSTFYKKSYESQLVVDQTKG